jgi:dTDP-4-amino-4,6-dideoxygalactose transaminase
VNPVPFNRAAVTGKEAEYVTRAIAEGPLHGDGPFTHACHQWLERLTGSPKALLTTSCTHALEMSALLLDLREGDEVIVPPFTFVSTVNAVVLRGARPVFVDIRPDTLNIDESAIEAAITPRTRGIVLVHYAGVACEMDRIMAIAERHGLAVVEDNAHGLFATYKGRQLGTFGTFATLSFHDTKNLSCGEGGALMINDTRFIERAEIIREKGTNRTRFYRGLADKYTWCDIGSSYLPSDILAAYLLAQLESHERIQLRRHELWRRYFSALSPGAAAAGVRLPVVPEHCVHPAHIFYLLMPTLEARTHLLSSLRAQKILAVFHYLPLHLSEMGRRLGGREGDCPVTENICDRLVRLPIFFQLTDEDQARVIAAVIAAWSA